MLWLALFFLVPMGFLGYQSRGELAQSLSAADVHLVPLHPQLARQRHCPHR